jgi:WD40 repeat protein
MVIVSDPNSGEVERTVEVGALVKALDFNEGKLVVGDNNGRIVEIDDGDEIKVLMNSHSTGETWGLDLLDEGRFVTSGDDNKVMVWNIEDHTCVGEDIVSEQNKKSRRGKASTMSKLAASKCARAVACNKAEVRTNFNIKSTFKNI